MEVLIVVPKGFDRFAQNENLLLYERLMKLLHDECPERGPLAGRQLIAGQGLSQEQVSHAWFVGISKGLLQEFKHWHTWRGKRLAAKPLVHKHRPENTLISVPEVAQDGGFIADLMLDDQNELMLDHLTGQHVQGMVLTEACRQMFLAVTERFCLEDYQAPKRYFVINTMTMRFQAFAFPLPAQIRYHVLEQKKLRADRVWFHADMNIYQGGAVVAGMEVKFTVFDDVLITQKENQLAASVVRQYVNELGMLNAQSDVTDDVSAFLSNQTTAPCPEQALL